MRELRRENCGLKTVEAAVAPLHAVVVLSQPAVIGDHPHPPGQALIVGDDAARVAICSEVLARIEAESSRFAEGPDLASLISCAVGLRTIFQDPEGMLLRDRGDLVHFGG